MALDEEYTTSLAFEDQEEVLLLQKQDEMIEFENEFSNDNF